MTCLLNSACLHVARDRSAGSHRTTPCLNLSPNTLTSSSESISTLSGTQCPAVRPVLGTHIGLAKSRGMHDYLCHLWTGREWLSPLIEWLRTLVSILCFGRALDISALQGTDSSWQDVHSCSGALPLEELSRGPLTSGWNLVLTVVFQALLICFFALEGGDSSLDLSTSSSCNKATVSKTPHYLQAHWPWFSTDHTLHVSCSMEEISYQRSTHPLEACINNLGNSMLSSHCWFPSGLVLACSSLCSLSNVSRVPRLYLMHSTVFNLGNTYSSLYQ